MRHVIKILNEYECLILIFTHEIMLMTDIEFFKKEVASLLSSFNLEYRSYADDDFGALEQVVFNTQNIGGNFDFWKSGWLGIYIYDYISDSEVCNKLLEPSEEHQETLKEIVTEIFVNLSICKSYLHMK